MTPVALLAVANAQWAGTRALKFSQGTLGKCGCTKLLGRGVPASTIESSGMMSLHLLNLKRGPSLLPRLQLSGNKQSSYRSLRTAFASGDANAGVRQAQTASRTLAHCSAHASHVTVGLRRTARSYEVLCRVGRAAFENWQGQGAECEPLGFEVQHFLGEAR
jgi:hypothetical protein